MSIVECSLECNDGEKLIRTGEVHNSNSGSHYYESLSTVLSTMKEDVNSILTVQVEKERRQPSQPQKRPTTDDDDDDDDEEEHQSDNDSDTPPNPKSQRTQDQ